jgi:hypothetical protein
VCGVGGSSPTAVREPVCGASFGRLEHEAPEEEEADKEDEHDDNDLNFSHSQFLRSLCDRLWFRADILSAHRAACQRSSPVCPNRRGRHFPLKIRKKTAAGSLRRVGGQSPAHVASSNQT